MIIKMATGSIKCFFFRNCADSYHGLLLDVFFLQNSVNSWKRTKIKSWKAKTFILRSTSASAIPSKGNASHFRSLLQHSHPTKMKRTVTYWKVNAEATNLPNVPLLPNSCRHLEQIRYHLPHPRNEFYWSSVRDLRRSLCQLSHEILCQKVYWGYCGVSFREQIHTAV
jgi:hypothetical protein